jgi:hypothetical protein
VIALVLHAACHNNNSLRAENFAIPACSLKDLTIYLETTAQFKKYLKKEFRNDIIPDSSCPIKLKTSTVNYLNNSIFEKSIKQVCGNQAITSDTFEDMFDRAYDPFYSSLHQDKIDYDLLTKLQSTLLSSDLKDELHIEGNKSDVDIAYEQKKGRKRVKPEVNKGSEASVLEHYTIAYSTLNEGTKKGHSEDENDEGDIYIVDTVYKSQLG